MQCAWCPALNRCSTGTDRKKQEWIHSGCERTLINNSQSCPALGSKGNNYAAQEAQKTQADEGRPQNTTATLPNKSPDASSPEVAIKKAALAHAMENDPKTSSVSFVVGLLLPIVFILSIVVWVFYAYRNPHTKSGQLLIQVRLFASHTYHIRVTI